MKKIITFALCTALLLGLCGCAKKEAPKPVSYEWTLEVLDKEEAKKLEEGGLFLLGREDSDYTGYYLFSLSEEALELSWNALSLDIDKDGKLMERERESMGLIAQLEKGEQILLAGECIGAVPNLGLSWKDAAGNMNDYYFQLSGEDGHPFLGEL